MVVAKLCSHLRKGFPCCGQKSRGPIKSDPEQIFLEPRKPGDDQHKIQEANGRQVSMEMMKNRLGVDTLEVLLILPP